MTIQSVVALAGAAVLELRVKPACPEGGDFVGDKAGRESNLVYTALRS